MTLAEILNRVNTLGLDLVEITGGEPLSQKNCPDLARLLVANKFTVLCETNGTYPIDVLPAEVIRIVDFKCPGSGESDQVNWDNVECLVPHDEVKFVIQDRDDYEWSKGIVTKYNLQSRCKAIHFSPVFGILEPSALAQWIMEDKVCVRLHLQIHKYIHTNAQQGTRESTGFPEST